MPDIRTLAASFMDNWRRTAHRITKYNPDNRDETGAYKVDEWTSISDIGKDLNGKRVTYADYISIEDKYILAIQTFCDYFDIKELEIKNLETHNSKAWDKDSLDLKGAYEKLRDNKSVSGTDIHSLARLILREYLWCDLERNEKGIHFGYDYYMYFDIGTRMQEELKVKIQDIGLYVE
ncbi:MAG TPA: hypothetical protein VGK59_07375, partial [Ohtaekwangia sp.]